MEIPNQEKSEVTCFSYFLIDVQSSLVCLVSFLVFTLPLAATG